jgi:hypothetical protein
VVDEVALRQLFFSSSSVFPVNIPLWLSTLTYHPGDEQ